MKIGHKELGKIIERAYEKRMPMFIWGAMGIGKSSVVRQVGRKIADRHKLRYSEDIKDINREDKFVLVDVRISQLDPSDLRGLPDIKEDKTVWKTPEWLPRRGQGILFFDELNLAPPSIQASAYQLILDRRLGTYQLPEGYVIVSAGNRLEDRANVFDMPAPLKNRFIHVELNPPKHEQWTDWAVNNNVDSRIIAFINFRPDLLFKFDPEGEDNAFPTPRSWEFASKLINGVENEKELKVLVGSAVGEGTAIEFSAFVKLQQKIDLKKLIENPDMELPQEPDVLYSVVSGLVGHYDKKYTDNFIRIILNLPAEHSVLLVKLLFKGTTFKEDQKKSKYRKQFLDKLGKYLIGW